MIKKIFCLFLLGLFCLHSEVFSEENIFPIDIPKSNKTVNENPASLHYQRYQGRYEDWLRHIDRDLYNSLSYTDKKLELNFNPCDRISLPLCDINKNKPEMLN